MFKQIVLNAIIIGFICHLSEQRLRYFEQKLSLNSNQEFENISSKCDTKSNIRCFGLPNDCLSKNNCKVLLTVQPTTGGGAQFSLFWSRKSGSTDAWVAAALSADQMMGDDSVTQCVIQSDDKTAIVTQGLTFAGKSGYGVNSVDVSNITDASAVYKDNQLSCQWQRSDNTKVKNIDFNIFEQKYYIMLAYGQVDKKGNPKHHSAKWVSDTAEYLARDLTDKLVILDKELQQMERDCKQPNNTNCFGLPNGCIEQNTCEIIMTINGQHNGTDFSIIWKRDNKTHERWVGAGISVDPELGNDSFTQCVLLMNNSVSEMQTYSTCDKESVCEFVAVDPVPAIGAVQTVLLENLFMCHWNRPFDTKVKNIEFDLSKNKYYIIFNSGKTVNDTIDARYSTQFISKEAYNLSKSSDITTTVMPITTENDSTGTPMPESTTHKHNGASGLLVGKFVLVVLACLLINKIYKI